MIRIRVVHASHLALAGAALLLVIALALAGFRFFRDGAQGAPEVYEVTQTAEAAAVFAAASAPARVEFGEPLENEHTDLEASGFIVEVIRAPSPSPSGAKRRVLIYHTHTHEAYDQVSAGEYAALEAWRTDDKNHSIVRVGGELARCLEELGVQAVHDTTDHEPPQLGTAYTRSLTTLESYNDQKFDLTIDLHRDAWDQSMSPVFTVDVDGQAAARLMVLIGNGEGFTEKPDIQTNLSFARELTDFLNQLAPGICRDVLIKTGRYNQHLRSPSILIEAGHNKNTLPEALNAMPVLARAIAKCLAPE